jgi:ABC-2 type transport system permease protein
MSILRGTLPLTRAHLLESLRSRTAFFWTIVVPALVVLLAGAALGGAEAERVSYLMPNVLTFTLITGTFFSVTFRMVNERQSGILRRYRATPVTALAVVLSHAATSFVTMALSLALQCIAAMLTFDVRFAGSALALIVVLLAGMAALVPLGLLVGSVARDSRTAPALTHLIFFPMMLFSGAAVYYYKLPKAMQLAGRVVPATYLMEALQAVSWRGEGLRSVAGPVSVLLLTAVVGAWVNALVFRWESTEPVRARSLFVAISALAVLYAGAALLAPDLRMARPPEVSDSTANLAR